jgi:hypothetical protein
MIALNRTHYISSIGRRRTDHDIGLHRTAIGANLKRLLICAGARAVLKSARVRRTLFGAPPALVIYLLEVAHDEPVHSHLAHAVGGKPLAARVQPRPEEGPRVRPAFWRYSLMAWAAT